MFNNLRSNAHYTIAAITIAFIAILTSCNPVIQPNPTIVNLSDKVKDINKTGRIEKANVKNFLSIKSTTGLKCDPIQSTGGLVLTNYTLTANISHCHTPDGPPCTETESKSNLNGYLGVSKNPYTGAYQLGFYSDDPYLFVDDLNITSLEVGNSYSFSLKNSLIGYGWTATGSGTLQLTKDPTGNTYKAKIMASISNKDSIIERGGPRGAYLTGVDYSIPDLVAETGSLPLTCSGPSTLTLEPSVPEVGSASQGAVNQSRLKITTDSTKPYTIKIKGPQTAGCEQYQKEYHGSGNNDGIIFPESGDASSLPNGSYTVEAYFDDEPSNKQSVSIAVNNLTSLEVTIPEGKGLNSEKIFSAKAGGQADFRIKAPSCPAWELKIDGKTPDVVNADGTTTPGQACSFVTTGTGNKDIVSWSGTCDKGIMADGTYTATLKIGSQSPTQTVKIDSTPPEIDNVEINDSDTSISLVITLKDPEINGVSSGLDEASIKLEVSDPKLSGTVSKSGNVLTYSLQTNGNSNNEENKLNDALQNGAFKISANDYVKNKFQNVSQTFNVDITSENKFSIKATKSYKVGPNETPIPLTIVDTNVQPFIKKGSQLIVIKDQYGVPVYRTTIYHPAIGNRYFFLLSTLYIPITWDGKANTGKFIGQYVRPGDYTITTRSGYLMYKSGVISYASSLANFKINIDNCGSEGPPELGDKLNYVFGQVTSGDYNTTRSQQMYAELVNIGINDSPTNRALFAAHLAKVFYDTTIPKKDNGNGFWSKQSTFIGPSGSVIVESRWQCQYLNTVILKRVK